MLKYLCYCRDIGPFQAMEQNGGVPSHMGVPMSPQGMGPGQPHPHPASPMSPVSMGTPGPLDMYHQSQHPNSIIRRVFGPDSNGLGLGSADMARMASMAGMGGQGHPDFYDSSKLIKHIKKEPMHNGSEPTSPNSMSMVHPDRRHICPHCYKGFKSRQQLTQHNLVHSNIRKYKCNFCERAFKQLSHLHQHHRIHTGEWSHQHHFISPELVSKCNISPELVSKCNFFAELVSKCNIPLELVSKCNFTHELVS